ncbi:Kelch repeat-containing protein [Nitrosococcus watsonii]|uniref:Kelch repeat-containing protein n=1 Tax=Nitrosococcus watsoni (strain C-113) TaxID=105559 RepID=D8K9K9_NITWC|nr:kelch repeat-containing protein [Nitrosococcus watsonii]ADJ27298.1 Kelch repeat-containing protein [Nitrosococcus watsonii C-113]
MRFNKIHLSSLLLLSLSFLAYSASEQWQQLHPMPTHRSEMAAAYLDGKIYAPGGLGGQRQFEVYDATTDSWEQLAPLPAPRHHLMATAHQGKIYVFGGGDPDWSPMATAWVYDPPNNRWRTLTPLPEPRYAGGAVSMGDFIYVVGGKGPSGRLLRYDPQRDVWTFLKAMKQRREHIRSVVFKDKIAAIGGRYQGVGELRSVEIYDPATDTWQEGPPLNTARGGHGAAVHQGKIYVFGGEVIMTGRTTLSNSEILGNLSGKWQPGPPLPMALHGMPAISTGSHLYILGGSEQAAASINRGRVYRLLETPGPPPALSFGSFLTILDKTTS